jgi:hypothetical protein
MGKYRQGNASRRGSPHVVGEFPEDGHWRKPSFTELPLLGNSVNKDNRTDYMEVH